MEKKFQADVDEVKFLLYNWLKKPGIMSNPEWLDQKVSAIKSSNQKKDVFLAFSAVSRFVGKNKLTLDAEDLAAANKTRKGWIPAGWSADQAARIYILLSLPFEDKAYFLGILGQLFSTAEVSELTALYLALPLYPYPEEFRSRAQEGFRTNINIVFNSIALNSPYPQEYLDESAWNQMVLKAIFIGSPLYKIQGFDERANKTLALTLSDFAHERWAAGRPVPPELWRAVAPFLDQTAFKDIERAIANGDIIQKKAAALACAHSDFEPAKKLLEQKPEFVSQIESGELSWDSIGRQTENSL